MTTRMMLDVVEVLRCFLEINNMCSSHVVLQESNVVLRCFTCWMMGYDHDATDDVRRVARVGCSG